MKRVISFFQWMLTAVAVGFVLLMASAFLPIPGALKVYTVRSGSMEPTIPTGALIFVHARPTYGVGDIITMREDNSKQTVTHRVVEVREEEGGQVFMTKGDANEEADTEGTKRSDIIGKMFFSLPYLGFPIAYAQTKNGFIALIIVPAILIIVGEFVTIGKEIYAMGKKRMRRGTRSRAPEPDDPLPTIRFMESTYPPMPLENMRRRSMLPPPRWSPMPEPRRRRKIV